MCHCPGASDSVSYKGKGVHWLSQQSGEVKVRNETSPVVRIVSLWKTIEQRDLLCLGSDMGTSCLTGIVNLFSHFVLTYLSGNFMRKIITL